MPLLGVPGLKPGPRLWHSFPGYQCRRQGRSAASSAQPCPCSGWWGSRCWHPGSHCPSMSSSELSYANSPRTLRDTERVTERDRWKNAERERGEREGERNTRLTHKWFHNRRDLYLDSIANNKRHSKGRIVLPPYDSVWQQHSAFHKVISSYRWHSKYLVSVWKRQSCKTKRAFCIKRQETVVEELKYKFSGTALR